MLKQTLLLSFIFPSVALASGGASSKLSRCAVYLQALTQPSSHQQEVIEQQNADALRALNQFRTAILSDFDFSPGDDPVQVVSEPSEALAHRISAIINRDGFKLGRQNVVENGFEALSTRVLAKVEEGEGAIRSALVRRQMLSGSSGRGPQSLFSGQLVTEDRLLEELSQLRPGQWFYHSFDVEAPAAVAEHLWRTHQLPPELENIDVSGSILGSFIKGVAQWTAARRAKPSESTEVLRVDELLTLDRYTQKPLLITVLRLAAPSANPNQGGGGGKLRVIELPSTGEELAEELEARGLKPIRIQKPR